MASVSQAQLIAIVLICLGQCLNIGTSAFDTIFDGVDSCYGSCDKTYPLHTYPKVKHGEACKRGCRFFSIGDFINDQGDVNVTKSSCDSSCQEAYSDPDERYACSVGCQNQAPFVQDKRKQDKEDCQSMHVLSPLMYVQKLYSTVKDHVVNFVSISWSYYIQQDNGNIIVVQSGPRVISSFPLTDDDDERKHHKGINTQDNPKSSANLFRRNHDEDALQLDDFREDLMADVEDEEETKREEFMTMDWLGCVSRKTGLPRWFLGMTIFVSSFTMIWLCFASSATTLENRVVSQKVNYLTDLDYLRYYDPRDKVKILPYTEEVASPLPVKVHLSELPYKST